MRREEVYASRRDARLDLEMARLRNQGSPSSIHISLQLPGPSAYPGLVGGLTRSGSRHGVNARAGDNNDNSRPAGKPTLVPSKAMNHEAALLETYKWSIPRESFFLSEDNRATAKNTSCAVASLRGP